MKIRREFRHILVEICVLLTWEQEGLYLERSIFTAGDKENDKNFLYFSLCLAKGKIKSLLQSTDLVESIGKESFLFL